MNNTIWAITTLYRFFPNSPREENFTAFRNHLFLQGIKLAVIEICSPNLDFYIKKSDCDFLLQFKTKSILWHKESSLNLLARKIPYKIKNLAWVDSDSIILNNDWPEQALETLKQYPFIQLVKECQFLDKDNHITKTLPSYSFMKTSLNPEKIKGFPGFGWISSRNNLIKYSLYDKAIVGGGDLLWADAIWNDPIKRFLTTNFTNINPFHFDYLEYKKKFQEKGNILSGFIDKNNLTGLAGCLNCIGQHLYHDEINYRLYKLRHSILHHHNYNPKKDLKIEEKTGLLEIINPILRDAVKCYFWFREQEKSDVLDYLFEIYKSWLSSIHKHDIQTNRKLLLPSLLQKELF